MAATSWKRRNLTIAICFTLALVFALYSIPSIDEERIKKVIPQTSFGSGSSKFPFGGGSEEPASAGEGAGADPEEEDTTGVTVPDTTKATKPADVKTGEVKTSRYHYLVPASKTNVELCYNLASSLVTQHGVPYLLGWNGTGEFDAAKTHLAKLRAMQVYFHSLDTADDDDLVLIADGYDVIMQLPPDIMIERYFDIADRADARLAKRFGISVNEARSRGLRQTIFWGPDKVCWPINWDAARCWTAPASNLGPQAFGPKTAKGEMDFADPRWLNSGTVIGPAGDLRKYIDATMEEIDATFDPKYENRHSDQYYLANVWGRQEYFRAKAEMNGGEVEHGPKNKQIPEKLRPDQDTELHISIEYESALFQTKAGYERFFGYRMFNKQGLKAEMNIDMFQEGDKFKPYDIQMPTNVLASLSKIFDSIADAHPGKTSKDWIREVKLGVNYVTEYIYGLWHCTGPKDSIGSEFTHLWFFPYVRPLLRLAVKNSQAGEPIAERTIDGRKWLPKFVYPDQKTLQDEFGGAWSDQNGGEFVPWKELCGAFEDKLFKGDAPPAPQGSA